MSKISDNWKKLSNSTRLVLISILIYSLTLLFHFLYVSFINPDFGMLISDQIVIYTRGQGIIQGKLPYRDFYTNAAPLSPYLWASMVVISMLGSGDYSTGLVNIDNYLEIPSMILFSFILRFFFALCIILSGLILLKLEEQRNNKHAFILSILYTINPFFLYLVSFWGTDECIVPLLILLPIYLFERGNNTLATLSIVLGAGLKYFPIFLAPLIWIYSKKWSERIKQTIIFFGCLILITVPFYLIAPQAFLFQFQDMLGEKGNQGLYTVIQSYFELELNQYNLIFQILTGVMICFVGVCLFVSKEKWKYQKTAAIFLIFLLLYPKIQTSYYVLVLPFIFVVLFLKGIIRWISLVLLSSGASMGVIANYLITNEIGLLLRDSFAWVVVIIFYLSIIVMIYLILRMNNIEKIEKKTSNNGSL